MSGCSKGQGLTVNQVLDELNGSPIIIGGFYIASQELKTVRLKYEKEKVDCSESVVRVFQRNWK